MQKLHSIVSALRLKRISVNVMRAVAHHQSVLNTFLPDTPVATVYAGPKVNATQCHPPGGGAGNCLSNME